VQEVPLGSAGGQHEHLEPVANPPAAGLLEDVPSGDGSEHEVQDHQGELVLDEALDRLVSGGGFLHLVTRHAQDLVDELADRVVVFDNEDASHISSFGIRRPSV
jgi:hypothetical protein